MAPGFQGLGSKRQDKWPEAIKLKQIVLPTLADRKLKDRRCTAPGKARKLRSGKKKTYTHTHTHTHTHTSLGFSLKNGNQSKQEPERHQIINGWKADGKYYKRDQFLFSRAFQLVTFSPVREGGYSSEGPFETCKERKECLQ